MPEQTDIPISSFPDAESITNMDKVTGIQGDANKNFPFSSILAWFINAVKSVFVPVNRTVNGKTLDTNITLTASDVGARPNTWTPSKSDIGLGNVADERQYSAQNPPPLPDAEDVLYDNTGSGLTANDVQAAIDELAQSGGGGPSPSDANPLMDGTAAPGTGLTYSRSDHVHPTDTSRAPSAAVAESLFQTATDIHGDTTVTLTKSFTDYAYLAVLVTPDSANTTLTRTMLMIPVNMLNLMPNVPVVLVDSNAQATWGYMTIGLVSTAITNQLRFRRTSFSSLYLQRINGIR